MKRSSARVMSIRLEKRYEGKAKIVYEESPGVLIQEFKDSATAFNGEKKAQIDGKGRFNCQFSSALYQYLATQGVANHLIKQIDERSQKITALKMIPLEVVVRNQVAGSLARKTGRKEGEKLEPALVEYYLKDDEKGDPQMSEEEAREVFASGGFSCSFNQLQEQSLEVNARLQPLFKSAGLALVDFKLEFGEDAQGRLILGDEISPDTCRIWDLETGEKLDKDRFRFDLGDVMEGYHKAWAKLSAQLV